MSFLKKIIILFVMITASYTLSAMQNDNKEISSNNEGESKQKKKKSFNKLPENLQKVIKALQNDPVNNELHLLALEGKREEIKKLYKERQNFFKENINNTATKECLTPLHCSLAFDNIKCVKLLIKYGASTKIKDNEKNSLMHLAAAFGSTHCLLYFLNQGMDINATNNNGQTPLQCAVICQSSEAVSWLLEHGAEINTVNNQNRNVMHLAAIFGLVKIGKILAAHDESLLNTADQNGRTPLHYAATNDHPEFISWLIEQKINIEIENQGYNAMHYAAQYDSLKAVQIIASISNDLINKKTSKDNLTPLQIATSSNKPHIIKLLINLKADINQVSESGDTLMHFAAKDGSIEAANELLIHTENNFLRTCNDGNIAPLFYAAINNQYQFIIWLLEHGADITHKAIGLRMTILHLIASINSVTLATTLFKWIKNIQHTNNLEKLVTQRLSFLPDDFTYTNNATPLKQGMKNMIKILLLCKKKALKNRKKDIYTLLWTVSLLPKYILYFIVELTFDPQEIIEYLLNMKDIGDRKPFKIATDEECKALLMPKNQE